MASQAAEAYVQPAGQNPREPSMEEILASIRRIIEDSDQVRKDEPELSPADEPEPAAPVRATLREAPAAAPQPLEAAMPRRRPAEPAEPAAPATRAETAMPARRPTPDGDAASRPAAAPVAQAAAAPRAAAPAQPARERPEPASEREEPARERDEPIQAAAAPLVAANNPGLALRDARASILSEQTGRQVAAAFGELSDAFAASRRRSFDEMAAEMIRPMLQDWLDNNLPTLVERLVREEIERIARGGE